MQHSLYRKYRPASFTEVQGQDAIVGTLETQVTSGTPSHAYLFAGSRGLGKTSIARIFARELGTSEKDLYEIDAASNNSVEDIRALTENIYTLPFESKYKLYILDEAHMLSKSAWNAFLKTLEEPPAYAIFILATTELEKVPDTVQSRCQVFEFKKPSRALLAQVVESVAGKEGKSLDPAAAELIALLADGSYRDALSILEKVLASTHGKNEKKVSLEITEAATGAPRRQLVEQLAQALSEGNTEEALKTIRTVSTTNVSLSLYLTLVLEYVRQVLLTRHAPELRRELEAEVGSENFPSINELAAQKDSKLTHETLKVFLDAAERMRFSPIPALPLELAVLELSQHGGHGTE